jgi:lipoate-protein ligase A
VTPGSIRLQLDGASTVERILARDEAALREGIPTVRIARVSSEAFSLGVSQRNDVPSAERARTLGILVLRRSSGGLGVYHGPGDLSWSVTLPRTDPRLKEGFRCAYGPLGEGPARLFADAGFRSRWVPAAGRDAELCLLGARGEVLEVEGRILGGAAQHLTSTTLLHHGVLPYQVDPERLAGLFGLSEEELPRRLVGYAELLPGVPAEVVASSLASALVGALVTGPGARPAPEDV